MFLRKKKQVQSPPRPEAPRMTIFGGVVVPEMYETFSYEGLEIHPEYGSSKIKNFCTRCGGDVKFDNPKPWQEILSSKWICGDCAWYRDKYEDESRETTEEIEELEGLHKKLFAAFTELLGREPASLEEDSLREAGLILHRENSEAVLGFILIDYNREQMHKLVTAVNGRLEPFSRGFQLFLPIEYYKLFPGSYYWKRYYYSRYEGRSRLDLLHEKRQEVETRADKIRSRIETYAVL